MKKILQALTLFVATLAPVSTFTAAAATPAAPADTAVAAYPECGFRAGDGKFLLDGEPFVVKAAELHYPRIPRPYWEHRIQMCKALGMNTICLYVFWNIHEQRPDSFDFTGQNDLRHFIELCRKNDMKVILRPGPYVCAEWEMGGLPWWLLQKKDIRLRELDPYFMERVDKFQEQVARQVEGLTAADGGPIIMVQVENEYGSYGTGKPYVAAVRDMLRKHFGNEVTLFQCDWSSNFLNNGLDDLIWTINFGTGADIEEQFAPLRRARPQSPLMCSEYWSGWFDKWGAGHETRPAAEMIKGIDDMLARDISFSLYMTHGGTNWGHWAGANSPGYAPDVTSYDYDAPINEAGQATPKYHELRKIMARYSGGAKLPPVPAPVKTTAVKEFELTEVAPLFANLPEPTADRGIKPMEEYGQGFGSILYRTTLPELKEGGVLTVADAHDYAQIFIDGRYLGALDRRNGDKTLTLGPTKDGAVLDILVEATGRINFGRAIKDYKGITDHVAVTETRGGRDFTCILTDWQVFNLPDDPQFYDAMEFMPLGAFTPEEGQRLPRGVYKGVFNVKKPADTFLDFSDWGKGLVYVNGHPLGRIWHIGPQQTLYMPGCWLKEGENEITVFDVIGPRRATVVGRKEPVLDALRLPLNAGKHLAEPDLNGLSPLASERLNGGNGWQKRLFARPGNGRYVCIQIDSAGTPGQPAAIAELYLLDADGRRIPRENWKATMVSSEMAQGNHTAEKTFDLQESTFWSATDAATPQYIVIDLGKSQPLTGIELLPRMEPGAPGSPTLLRLYTSDTPFRP